MKAQKAELRQATGPYDEVQQMRKEAIAEYNEALEIRRRLAVRDPSNSGWQNNLAATRIRIASMQVEQSNLGGAILNFTAAIDTLDQLAGQSPENVSRQRDLFIARAKLGDAYAITDNHTDALAQYRKALAGAEPLLTRNIGAARWQISVAYVHNRIAAVLAPSDPEGALQEYRLGLQIAEQFAQQSPDNPDRQRDISVARIGIGYIFAARNQVSEAMQQYQAGLVVLEPLVAKYPKRNGWRAALDDLRQKIQAVTPVR